MVERLIFSRLFQTFRVEKLGSARRAFHHKVPPYTAFKASYGGFGVVAPQLLSKGEIHLGARKHQADDAKKGLGIVLRQRRLPLQLTLGFQGGKL